MRYALLTAALACVAAAPAPQCLKAGQTPSLTGDPFAPVECSSGPAAALPLPEAAVSEAAKPDLKALAGTWEGVLIRGVGRYASTVEVAVNWRGKADLALRWKEQQLRSTGGAELSLTPAKDKGAYAAVVTAGLLPGASLSGTAKFSLEPAGEKKTSPRADLSFPNGAAHRVRWSLPAKDVLRFTAQWSVPGAPLQALEGELRRVKP